MATVRKFDLLSDSFSEVGIFTGKEKEFYSFTNVKLLGRFAK